MKSVLRFILWVVFTAFLFALFGFVLGFIKAINQDYFAAGYLYLAFSEIYKWVWSLAVFGAFALSPAILLYMITHRLTGSRPRAFAAGFAIPLAWVTAFSVAAYLIQTRTISHFGYLAQAPFNAFDVLQKAILPFFVTGAAKHKKLWLPWIVAPCSIINIAGIIIGLILQFLLRFFTKKKEIKLLPIKYFGSIGAFGLIGLFLIQSASDSLRVRQDATKPNVILISIDTLRADHVGLYGYERDTTPNIDALGKESVVFSDLITPSPWTLPSHASMLTGHTPMVHGATRSIYTIHDNIFLLPEVLKQQGYNTVGIISVIYLSPGYGFSGGFDHYFFFPHLTANQLTNMAIKATGAIKKPFFLFFHLFDPHWPYEAPDEYKIFSEHKNVEGMNGKMFYEFAKFILDAPDEVKKDYIALYDAEIYFTDSQLGRLFEFLKQQNLWDNTIIVLTSDHGEELYDHGFWGHTFFLYQESIHAPLIIKPQKSADIKPKKVSKLVGTIDIAPTILDLLGYSFPKEVEGKSLTCLMKGECENSWTERYTSYTAEAGCSRTALRDVDWKYLQGGWCKFADIDLTRPDMLFNLAQDPKEQKDLAGSQPTMLSHMQVDLENWLLALTQKWPIRYQKPKKLTKETEEQLKALGYIQ